MIYKNPWVLESLLDKMTAFLMDYGSALTERGANVIFIPEPSASASMISPATFLRFVLPRLKTLISHLKVPCILHICGDTSTLMAPMSESGADILSLDQCMNLSAAREKAFGVVLAGNVDPVEALLMGNEEEVRKDTLRSLESGGTHRFILMTGCGVPAATKRENMAAMVTTAKTYGLGG
jgi:MtaA/CmuA family methyltransferase